MRLTTAMICGSLDVQNGFAYILQGGASRFGRPAFPAAVQFHLLLQIVAESLEDMALSEVQVQVWVKGEHITFNRPSVVGTVSLEHTPLAAVVEDEKPTILLPMPISFVAPAPGLYEIDIRVEPGEMAQRLPFAVHAAVATAEPS